MVRVLIYVFNVVFVFVMAWIVSRILRQSVRGGSSQTGSESRFRKGQRPEIHRETARDPVCGMFVSTELSHRLESEGKVLHFCSPECLEKYQLEARRA